MPQLRNVLDCLTSTELKFQGDLLTKHDATEQHERPQKESPPLGHISPGPPRARPGLPRSAGPCRRLGGSPRQTPVLIGPRLQLPSNSALFYIEGGFYTSGPVGLSTMPPQPNRARFRTRAPPTSSPPHPNHTRFARNADLSAGPREWLQARGEAPQEPQQMEEQLVESAVLVALQLGSPASSGRAAGS